MKNVLLMFLTVASAAGALCAKPVVSGTEIDFDSGTCLLSVRYRLSEPAVVTARVYTNDVALPVRDIRGMAGEVNRFVADASAEHVFRWQLSRAFDAAEFDASELKVELTAWRHDLLPDYMVVDLVCTNTVRFYETERDIPGGLGRDGHIVNRTDRLVMRRIPAKNVRFRMGFTEAELEKYTALGDADRNGGRQHYVSFTSDYYIGVYPVTQSQCLKFCKSSPSLTGFDESPSLPMENIGYEAIRGKKADGIDYPSSSLTVGGGSFLGTLRAFTGVEFDLPTDAQWEYAARAGSRTQLPNGLEMVGGGSSFGDANADTHCWSKAVSERYWGAGIHRPGPVGYLEPNGWGLYDVMGNVKEWCRDWYQEDISALADNLSDPAGPASGTARVWHGGPCLYNVVNTVLSRRGSLKPSSGEAAQLGFRLWAPGNVFCAGK